MMTTKGLAWTLVFLTIFSKLSFQAIGVPHSFSYFIFQHGLHPFANIALNFLISFPLLLKFRSLAGLSRGYRWILVSLIVVLIVQTILQVILGGVGNVFMLSATLASTLLLIYVFGGILPQTMDLEEFIEKLGKIFLVLTLISILMFFVGAPGIYKGNRFVGVFKHIPYMVTCCSLGFFLYLGRWKKCKNGIHLIFYFLALAAFVAGLVLTGTRSALGAVLIGGFGYFFLIKPENLEFRMLRLLGIWLMVVFIGFFGVETLQFAKDVATGQKAIGQRDAQDGVSDRLEEIQRGFELFSQNPNLGLGLMSKFGSSDADEVVTSYNSFQDPHNIFISAGVVGGWPLMLWTLVAYVIFLIRIVQKIMTRESSNMVLGFYLLSHAPILFIYHMHLSLGGMADRMYWICFGYLGLSKVWTSLNKV